MESSIGQARWRSRSVVYAMCLQIDCCLQAITVEGDEKNVFSDEGYSKRKMPEIVPMSSSAAGILEFGKGKTETSIKKVYPNDPCPCGSGKKFKKCCGRK